jgi:hypothetical protein
MLDSRHATQGKRLGIAWLACISVMCANSSLV